MTSSAQSITSLFSDLPKIGTVEHYASIGSTNDRARELAAAGAPEIALVVADEQRLAYRRLAELAEHMPAEALEGVILV